MNLLRSVGAIASASGEATVDWDAAVDAATAAIEPGSLDLEPGERTGYAADVRDARDQIREISTLTFDLPDVIEIQHRHHWINANVGTFQNVLQPLADREVAFPGVTRTVNTATMACMLAFLGRHVLGQYDPLLLAEANPRLYFVRPNVRRMAAELDVDHDRFRRWIVVHEVAHVAEFGAAPWLDDHLEAQVEEAMDAVASRDVARETFHDLNARMETVNATMTAVEGYAEFLMDRAFDERYDDLREKVDERRQGGGPFARVVRRILGLGLKRQQYERGKAFFDEVAAARGIEAAGVVWDDPANLPEPDELDTPAAWLRRVDP